MNPEQQQSLLAIALFAGIADGTKKMQTQYPPQFLQRASLLNRIGVISIVWEG